MRDVLFDDLRSVLTIHENLIGEGFVVDALICAVEAVCEHPALCKLSDDVLPQFRELLQDLHHMELDIDGVVIPDDEVV